MIVAETLCFTPLVSLRLASEWPDWLVVLIAIVLGVGTIVMYLRETRSLSAPWSWLLPGLRATSVVLIFFLLAGPVWHRRQIIGTPATIVWAVDRSMSMSESDSQSASSPITGSDATDSKTSRMRRATDQLFGFQDQPGWVDSLDATHLMSVTVFDETVQSVWTSNSADSVEKNTDFLSPDTAVKEVSVNSDASNLRLLEVADGSSTDLSVPLRALLDQSSRDRTSITVAEDSDSTINDGNRVLVVMSDGRDSVGQADATELASQLADRGWQVHAVGFGSLDEPQDLGIVTVDVPERVADDGRLAGQVWLKHYGIGSQQVRVQILSGDDVVWTNTLDVDTDGKSPVAFDFAIESLMNTITSAEPRGMDVRGVDRESVVLPLTAEVSVVGRSDVERSQTVLFDSKTQNDSYEFRVAAASRDRQLLILDGSSRWETRYLRNLFSRDPAWQVDTVLFGSGTDNTTAVRGNSRGELPDSSRSWERYDAVILGEVPPDQWTATDAESLSDFVARGGGLIVLDGRYGRIGEWLAHASNDEANPMAHLIPVRVNDAGESQTELNTPRLLEPTDSGRSHPVLLLDSEFTDELWKKLPPPTFVTNVQATADAEVWVEAIDGNGQKSPWLVTRLFGSGRVFYLASDQTWRWRYKVEGRLHRRFWNQLLTAAMQPPFAVSDEFVAIGSDKVEYNTGESANIRVRIKNDLADENNDTPGLATTVDAVLLRDKQVVATIPMHLENSQRQTYTAQTAPLIEGEYEIQVRASGFDATALKASSPIWVRRIRSAEMDRLAVDEASLKQIANAGGGIYVHESSATEVLEAIKPLSRGQIIETDISFIESWWVFLLILLLLSIEWSVRKKVGLA